MKRAKICFYEIQDIDSTGIKIDIFENEVLQDVFLDVGLLEALICEKEFWLNQTSIIEEKDIPMEYVRKLAFAFGCDKINFNLACAVKSSEEQHYAALITGDYGEDAVLIYEKSSNNDYWDLTFFNSVETYIDTFKNLDWVIDSWRIQGSLDQNKPRKLLPNL